MSAHDNGGPAFPYNFPPDNPFGGEGMSLRDWFAGRALAGIGSRSYDHMRQTPEGMCAAIAADAYAIADAMLRERAKAEGQS